MTDLYPLPSDLKAVDDLPRLVIDTREQTPFHFRRLAAELGTLYTGDYSIAGLEERFAIERKSVSDLVSCCKGANRERFQRELHRLRGYDFARLLIVGTRRELAAGEYRSAITPQAVLATVAAIEARYCPVVFAGGEPAAAALVESWAAWFWREWQPARRRRHSTQKKSMATV
ncbi:MAG: hypothetical protein JJU00_04495 [Opitutales bacterium]|nr:hypothetical protein [Opitutales bacterium]